MGKFRGFFPETFAFFQDIRFHNDKLWFEAHRDDFEAYVKGPLEALCEELSGRMLAIDPRLDLRPRRVVSRIYRDARYARGVPYRDHMWLSFKPVGKSNSEAFTYYFYIEEAAWGYGLGFYDRVPEIMDPFRHRLRTRGPEWLELVEGLPFAVQGDLPRRLKPTGLDSRLERWYHYRKFGFSADFPLGPEVYSPAVADMVGEGFLKLAPVYRFVNGINDEERADNE